MWSLDSDRLTSSSPRTCHSRRHTPSENHSKSRSRSSLKSSEHSFTWISSATTSRSTRFWASCPAASLDPNGLFTVVQDLLRCLVQWWCLCCVTKTKSLKFKPVLWPWGSDQARVVLRGDARSRLFRECVEPCACTVVFWSKLGVFQLACDWLRAATRWCHGE